MQLKIINKTGIGNNTKIIVIDGNDEIGHLSCVKKIEFNTISCGDLIRANLDCYINKIDLIVEPKKKTRPILHFIHNKKEMERLGLGRIN